MNYKLYYPQTLYGTNLKTIRNEQGMTLEKFSELLGISSDAYKNYEQGISFPSPECVLGINKYFGYPIHEICGFKVNYDVLKHKNPFIIDVRELISFYDTSLILTINNSYFKYLSIIRMGHSIPHSFEMYTESHEWQSKFEIPPENISINLKESFFVLSPHSLNKIREYEHLTITKMANKIGIDSRTYSNYLTNPQKMPIKYALLIANTFGYTFEQIYNLEDSHFYYDLREILSVYDDNIILCIKNFKNRFKYVQSEFKKQHTKPHKNTFKIVTHTLDTYNDYLLFNFRNFYRVDHIPNSDNIIPSTIYSPE